MNNQKKLIVGISYEGTVNLLDGQLQYFNELGYKTYLISPYGQRAVDFCKKENCELIAVPIKREISLVSDFINLIRIIFIFLKYKPDIVNLGTPKVALLGLMAAKITGVKRRIYTCRGFRFEHESGMTRRILVLMEKITGFCAQRIICISPSVEKFALENNLFSKAKTMVINYGSSNGVNLKLFNNKNISEFQKTILKQELNLTNKFIFGFVGRLADRKGIKELLDAFLEIYKSNENTSLLIVGPIENSQIKDISVIETLKNHPGIVYTGNKLLNEIPFYISILDVFVLPAWWEGFGNVLVQAAAMKVPVITTDATGTKDAVSHQYNGIIIPKHDIKELKNAMLRLYEDKALREKFGENGIIWASNFNNKIIWDGMNNIYLNKN
jgi:glycosyltransferase involved in cell wall biosynthesis